MAARSDDDRKGPGDTVTEPTVPVPPRGLRALVEEAQSGGHVVPDVEEPPPSLPELLSAEVGAEPPLRYEVHGVEGKGGQARVLDVLDRYLGRHVALKEMMDVRDRDLAHMAESRFLIEARVTSRLEHPNIVPIHELGRRADGRLYYTMRLVHGETLSTRLKACAGLPERLALLGAFWDTCKAIGYAHSRGVIHRDLKPANVMVGKHGETVLLDWGLAKIKGGPEARPITDPSISLPAGPDLTGDGKAMGTPSYMSPEQAAGEEIDERTDVWGLGSILYRILTGNALYATGDYDDRIARATWAGIRPVLAACPEAPPELAAIAHKALQRYPRDRYQTARELADEIGSYMTGGRVRAYSYSPWALMRRFAADHRGAVIASLVALLTIVGALVAVTVALRQQTAARAQEQRERLKSELNLAGAYAERADRYLADFRYASAYGFAALSLQHNPAHPSSPAFQPGFEKDYPRGKELRVLATSTALQARSHFGFALSRTFKSEDALGTVSFSPDGRAVVAAAYDGTVRVWDVATGGLRLRLPGDGVAVYAALFSPDGTLLATAGKSGEVVLWRAADGARLFALPGHQGPVRALAFSPDGARLASAGADRTVRVWDLGARRARVLLGHGAEVRAVAFGPDGRRLLSGGVDRTVRSWDLADADPTGFVLASLAFSVRSIALSPDGARLAVGCDEPTVAVLDARTGEPDLSLSGHEGFVRRVAWSPDGALIASAGVDRTVRVFSALSGQAIATLEEHAAAVAGVAFSPDGKRLASAAFDGTLHVFDAVASPLFGFAAGGAPLLDLAYSSDGRRVATASRDGTLRVWDLASRKEFLALRGELVSDPHVCISPDGTLLAGAGGAAEIWSVATGQRVLSLALKDANSIRFSRTGATVATGGDGGAASLWDVKTGALLVSFAAHTGAVFDLAFSPDGRALATAGKDGLVRLWDAKTGERKGELKGHESWVSSLDFARDGRLVSAGKDGRAIVWDPATGRELLRLQHSQWTLARFVGDGRHLATACDDQYVRFWDSRTGEMRLQVRGARGLVSMDIAPDGSALAVNLGRGFSILPIDLSSLEVDPARVLVEAHQRGFEEAPVTAIAAPRAVLEH